MRFLALLLVCASGVMIGCGNNSSPADMQIDMQMVSVGPDMDVLSACGHPGDKGNSKGIGQYCDNNTPCTGALLCSNINNGSQPANQQTYFCTTTCPTAGPNAAVCGDDTTCACKTGSLCACVPNSCLTAGMDS